ncbi:ABC transporter ATP-binding protein [Candidatus Methylacidiphilum fumarolicum]|uniref:Toluene tolerance efflux transporter (ABC superfamily, atp_bind) n=2 Tax=Candidatus Methylacidiphilum fumarolicum TaxID=591154 RepID=I0JX46_METFB|nr:ATP-binding cassette domain-containing protein [Candidatus Methylacidiphilum fumarolicum]MBW6414502.1 ATP-binding cassette domain-containing protein [Candidatus Methylacidiphilum fumarolicum]TFE67299.1 ABC transporter ATP-binding protein [Candidatus Methylacidiphilum fumarolicum]TFE72410.1 ABC transporter ATP-binding protein [Candidatus Methylacidiphilum fumarolicum]TFE75847.1 ABC transporter ATP-binding protein [Candidatus Methylacidiphilum fumarolicum]TFE77779.1 ABC transporter ATP-bindin
MLKVVNIKKTFNGTVVLDGVNFEILEGDRFMIIGRSGGGKSVLLRIILGLIKPDSGEVWYKGQNIVMLSERKLAPLRRDMGMVFQNGALFDFMTVEENVAFALREKGGMSEKEIKKEVSELLERLLLKGQEKKMPSELSGGMRKRVAVARAVIAKPKIIFFDEPTAGLDPIASSELNALICSLNKEFNVTTVIVTHDMEAVRQLGITVAMLYNGKIYRIGTPQEFETSMDPVIRNFVHGIIESEARCN